MATATVHLFAPHRGRRARPGPARRAAQAVTAAHLAAAVAAVAVVVTSGVLFVAHPYQHQGGPPRCAAWHACQCRYPGAGNNQLCRITRGAQPTARP
jgi:hypothetical protein